MLGIPSSLRVVEVFVVKQSWAFFPFIHIYRLDVAFLVFLVHDMLGVYFGSVLSRLPTLVFPLFRRVNFLRDGKEKLLR